MTLYAALYVECGYVEHDYVEGDAICAPRGGGGYEEFLAKLWLPATDPIVAMVRALAKEYGLELDDDVIEAIAAEIAEDAKEDIEQAVREALAAMVPPEPEPVKEPDEADQIRMVDDKWRSLFGGKTSVH